MTTARRRGTAALAVSAVLGTALVTAAAPAALAATTPSPSAVLPAGLYGTGDPTYDGVWRQSLALLAQDTAGVRPARQAVDWLTAQSCANGAYPAYRTDTTGDCGPKSLPDTNATAAAVQALAALGGRESAVEKSVTWLKSVQNADGGWSYNPGGASDANSTSLVIGALAAAGERPDGARSEGGKSPYDALLTFARPCDDREHAGAFVYQPEQPGIVGDSTAAAVTAAAGKGLVVAPDTKSAKTGTEAAGKAAGCGPAKTLAEAAGNGAGYLAAALAKTGQLLQPPLPGSSDPEPKPDFGTTADAVVALAAQGRAADARKALTGLERDASGWAKESGPAAYAQLVLAAHAMGGDPRDFGGTDLVAALNATGPEPERASAATGKADDSGSGAGTWWFAGALLAAAAGVGFLFTGRRRNRS
ncbi:prenyltransferase/squalene oxidase repeat-containing protein [Streptomyces yaizuensis]|uniref:Terpene cyclase/mutase family protein n=1 Tax=Streptomyces yaizuensis TaxID=2989713 RepID=A0ABQ5NUN8_9ACTN|nr:prenyltransferase/squalene oxidase repeat-containing protein [Streptomyces sp. YSPA8]GLF93924.1 terpene cyclase/mutase family protein [Streptomyces sp. YSPA8]